MSTVSAATDRDTKTEWLRQVGRRVRLARVAAGLTQEQAGKASGTSRLQVNRIENGTSVTLVRFWRIADAIGVSPIYLLTGEEPSVPFSSAGTRGAGS